MPFSLKFEGPTTGTTLNRTWTSAETPPATIDVEFIPASRTQSLVGSPSSLFVDATPAAGKTLVARLTTPTQGSTATKTLTIDPSDAPAEEATIGLHWG